jgi:hypothetical protein
VRRRRGRPKHESGIKAVLEVSSLFEEKSFCRNSSLPCPVLPTKKKAGLCVRMAQGNGQT